MKLYTELESLLKSENNYIDDNGELKKWVIINKSQNYDEELILLLLENEEIKATFFIKIKEVLVFNQSLFIQFLEQKNYLKDSYTSFKNKIGLTIDGKFLNQRNEVALVWPYKDCVLEGGQSREEDKRKEIFFNEILAQDEINQLLEPKVLTNAKKFTIEGEKPFEKFNRNEEGTITDNLIIKGNNLLALHSLKEEFVGKVKLIYIDPPYNTGSDSFGYNDSFNHSTWLTFMKNRLEVAKKLLLESGSIWISLDDSEAHYCKILCDEIFGENNFLADIIWNSTKSVTNTALISTSHTHNLVYFKSKDYYIKNRTEFRLSEDGSGFSNPDNDPRGLWKADPFQVGGWRPNQQYEIIDPNTGVKYNPNKGSSWKNDFNKFQELIKENRIIFGSDGKSAPQRKRFLSEALERGKVTKTIWTDIETTTNGTQHLKNLFSEMVFSNPKPESLIQRIIELSTNENDIVLDYHLGSGTTATTAHKMKRQYIGVEQMNYIEDVSVERLKKVIEGEQGGISKTVNWQGGGEFIYLELKKHNENFIDKIQTVKDSKAILKIWDEMKVKSFLNYNVDIKKQEEHIEDFKKLTLEEQKIHLVSILDKNQLYVNCSSLKDKDSVLTLEEIQTTKDFYQLK